jgi:ribonuclease Z
MVPTKDRNHMSILLRYENEGILVDCGEGTQRQLKIAKHSITEVTKLLITHWHGDHVLGIPGLIQSLGSSQYSGKLKIYGPIGTKQHMEYMLKAFVFDNKVDFEIIEIETGIIIETSKYRIEAYPLEHGITTIGYKFIEKDRRRINLTFTKKKGIPEGPLLGKLQNGHDIDFKGEKISVSDATIIVPGKIISFMFDTGYCKNCLSLAQDADVLIADASFASDLDDKAELRKHLTARQAAEIAQKSSAKRLFLTHFSTRYTEVDTLEEDAKEIFADTTCAYDFLKIKI